MKIISITFRSPVSLGGLSTEQWHAERPGSTAMVGKVSPRPGSRQRGDRWDDSFVFEIRNGSDAYDVEIPASNIAQVNRAPTAVATDGKEKR